MKLQDFKDYFFFNKNEKIASLLLLILVLLSGGLYIMSGVWVNYTYYQENKLALAEFDEFQRSLRPVFNKKTKLVNGEYEDNSSTKKERKPKIDRSKLTDGQIVDLNSANIDALKRIPGIGDTFAQRIIDYRNRLGGFADIEQLKEVQGFTKKKFESITPFFEIKRKHGKLRINKLSFDQLTKHPYLSESQAKAIIETRSLKKIKSIEDILALSEFSDKEVDRLIDYLSFN